MNIKYTITLQLLVGEFRILIPYAYDYGEYVKRDPFPF